MENILPLVAAFLVAFALACGLGWLRGFFFTRKVLRRHLFQKHLGLTSLREKLRVGPGFWTILFGSIVIICGGLAYLAYLYLAALIEENLLASATISILTMIRDAQWSGEVAGPDYRVIPWGVLASVFVGMFAGFIMGQGFARKLILDRHLLTSRLRKCA